MKQLKTFLTKIKPTVSLTKAPLSGQKAWWKGWGDWFRQCLPPKSYYFLHQQFSIPTSYTHILLSFSIHILSLQIHWPIIHVIFSFGRIIIDIVVYGRKWKMCINILLSFSIHILSFAHMLTYNSLYFLKRVIIDIIVYERKRKTCIIFRKK